MRILLVFLVSLLFFETTKAQNTDFSYRELNYPTEKGDPFLKDKADLTKAEVKTLLRSGEGKDFTHPELARWATMEVLKSYLDDENFTPAKKVDGELKPLTIEDIDAEEFNLQLVSAPDTLYNVFATLNDTTAGYFTRASYEDEKLFVVDVLCMDNRYRRLAVLSKACGNPVRMVVATGPEPESTASTPESEGGTVGGSSSDTTITAPAGSTIHVTQTVTQNNTQSGAQESQTPVEQYQEPNYSSYSSPSYPSYYDAGYSYPSSYYDYYYPRRGSSNLYAYAGYSSYGGAYGGIGYSSSGSYGYGGGYGYGGSYGYGGYHGGSYNNCYCGYSHYGKCANQYYGNHWSSGGTNDGDVTVTINNNNSNTNTNNNTVGDTDGPDDDTDGTDDGGPVDHTSGDTDYDGDVHTDGGPVDHTSGNNIANTGSGGSGTSFKQRSAGGNTSSDKQLRTEKQTWDRSQSSERTQVNFDEREVAQTDNSRSWDESSSRTREQRGEYHSRSTRTDQRSRAEIGSRNSNTGEQRVRGQRDRNVQNSRARDDRNVAYNPRPGQDRSREITSRNNPGNQRRTEQRSPQRTRFDGRSRLVGQENRSMNRDRGRVHQPRSRVERSAGPQRGSRTIERSQRDRGQARPSPQRRNHQVDRGQQNRPAINRTPNRTHERSQVSPPRNRGNVQRSAPNRGAQRNASPRRGGGRR